MRKILLAISLSLLLVFSLITVSAKSINIKMNPGGDYELLRGEPEGSVLLSKNKATVIIKNLVPDRNYSIYYNKEPSTCLQLKTNNLGNAKKSKKNWINLNNIMEGKELLEGEERKFRVYFGECKESGPSGNDILMGIEDREKIREKIPSGN